jgi:hypothetical protein
MLVGHVYLLLLPVRVDAPRRYRKNVYLKQNTSFAVYIRLAENFRKVQ